MMIRINFYFPHKWCFQHGTEETIVTAILQNIDYYLKLNFWCQYTVWVVVYIAVLIRL